MDKDKIKVDLTPGVSPKDLEFDELEEWTEKYDQLSSEEKILIETQEQTRMIKRISNNVLFFFWLTILSLGVYVIITVFVLKQN